MVAAIHQLNASSRGQLKLSLRKPQKSETSFIQSSKQPIVKHNPITNPPIHVPSSIYKPITKLPTPMSKYKPITNPPTPMSKYKPITNPPTPMSKYKPITNPLTPSSKYNITNPPTLSSILDNRTLHSTPLPLKKPNKIATSNVQLQCEICGMTYSHRSGLYKHMKVKHLEARTVGSMKCRESNCTFNCHYLPAMRKHLIDRHSIAMEIEQLKFDSTEGEYRI